MNNKTTSDKRILKRALLVSVTAMLLCISMLAGTTFAWFTDSATSGGNKIQSGKLDVTLEMKQGNEWVNAEGVSLSWKKASGAESETVLWEPGCTYELPELRVKNQGNVALKYQIIVSGIVGDAPLLSALEFTYGDGIAINTEVSLEPNQTKGGIIIKGHMKEEAGNEYMGLAIDNISITVIAAQLNFESDSFGNLYDQNAPYNRPQET